MPFTFVVLHDRRPGAVRRAAVLGLLLQGRDPRPTSTRAAAAAWSLGVAGYVGAFLTAIYTFRMIFRAFWGEPCPEARELEHGHLAPRRGAVQPGQRRDRGHRRRLPRPRAPHRRARDADEGRDGRARGAGRRRRRSCRSRASTTRSRSSSSRRSPTRTLCTSSPRDALTAFGLVHRRACIGLAGILIAYRIWVVHPGTASALRERFAALHTLFVNKWYFDELIDVARRPPVRVARALRPARRSSAWSSTARFVGGTTGIVQRRLGRGPRAADRLPALLRARCSCSASPASPSTS